MRSSVRHTMRRCSGLRAVLAAFLAFLLVTPVAAQKSNLGFEVSSIRRTPEGTAGQTILLLPTGRFTAINMTLRDLIAHAYGEPQPLSATRIIGGPTWMASERFNVEAVAGREFTNATVLSEMLPMLRALLAQRFQLKARQVEREVPVYALVAARPERAGRELRRNENGCSKRSEPRPEVQPSCEMTFTRGKIVSRGHTLEMFRSVLSRYLDRVLIDETALTGDFDIDLEWTPEALSPASGAARDKPSIFTAVQEQLGLKLEPRQAPVQVVLVDSAELPSEN